MEFNLGNNVPMQLQFDEKFMRQLKLGEPQALPGVATPEERKYYFQLSKRGQGFTPEERR